jgi:hypothetical protein
MSTPNIGLTDLRGYGLTPAQIKAQADPHLLPDAHRWLFFDVTAPHNKYVLNQTTGYFLPLALGVQPINFQTGTTYTLTKNDLGLIVDMNNASANTLTVPNDTIMPADVGTIVDVAMSGAGITTIAAGGGVSLQKATGDSFAISAQYRSARLRKVAANTWRVSAL